MGKNLTDFGIGAGESILDFGLNQLGIKINSERQYALNEKAAENAMKRQIALTEMYQTPAAQKRLLENAGISPAVMLGMQGASGTGTNNAPQGNGVGLGINQTTGIGNNALTAAQIDNIKADTAEKLQNVKVKEWEKELIKVKIPNIEAQTKNFDAETNYRNLMSDWQEITNNIQVQTQDLNIAQITANTKYAQREAEKALWDAAQSEINYRLTDENYEEIKRGVYLQNLKMMSEINKNEQQIKQEWKRIKIAANEYNLKLCEFYFEKEKFNTDKRKWNAEMKLEYEKLKQEVNKAIRQLNQNAEIRNLQHTEFLESQIVDVMTSLISLAGMYMVGGYGGILKGAQTESKQKEEYEKYRNIVLYGNEYGDPNLEEDLR